MVIMCGKVIFMFLFTLLYVTLAKKITVNPDATIECHRREFTYRAVKTDVNGRQCWDLVTAMSCWGRCDTGEIGDWRFPFKRSFHSVCVHEITVPKQIILRHCDPDTDLSLSEYQYEEALTCSCLECNSASTSCQGIGEAGRKGMEPTLPPLAEHGGFMAPDDVN